MNHYYLIRVEHKADDGAQFLSEALHRQSFRDAVARARHMASARPFFDPRESIVVRDALGEEICRVVRATGELVFGGGQ